MGCRGGGRGCGGLEGVGGGRGRVGGFLGQGGGGGGGGWGSFWGRAGGGITITNVTMDRSWPRGGVSFWLWRVSVDGVITAAAAVLIVLGQTLHFEILCDCEERVEFLLGNVDFSMIHEVEHSLKIA